MGTDVPSCEIIVCSPGFNNMYSVSSASYFDYFIKAEGLRFWLLLFGTVTLETSIIHPV